MLQGACIYRDLNNYAVLKIYKELEKGFVLDIIYSNNILNVYYTKSKIFTSLFPKECIHIVYKLPYYEYDLSDIHSIYNLINNYKKYNKKTFIYF